MKRKAKTTKTIPLQLKKSLLGTMLRIRAAEEKIVEKYPDQTMKTPTHLSIGQEAVATGVCLALKSDDQVFAGHRCHAAYLAKGGSLDAFFGELCGRQTGVSGGRAGSAHLSDPSRGMFSSPILGGMIPVAVGAALSFQMDHSQKIAVAFFGDAAIEEGAFPEAFNFAVIRKLPVLFVCENNLYSTHSHIRHRQPPLSIAARMSSWGVGGRQCDGNDVELVYETAQKAIRDCRGGKGPAFLEFLTYRFREHVGPLYDYDKGYRSKAEVEKWQARCPLIAYRKKLIAKKDLTADEINSLEKSCLAETAKAYDKALQSPWPQKNSLLQNVY